jgi:hypothetical protein
MSVPQNRHADHTETACKTRKRYAIPRLIAYGGIQALTQNVDPMGTLADGTGMFAKTV